MTSAQNLIVRLMAQLMIAPALCTTGQFLMRSNISISSISNIRDWSFAKEDEYGNQMTTMTPKEPSNCTLSGNKNTKLTANDITLVKVKHKTTSTSYTFLCAADFHQECRAAFCS